MGLFSLSCHQLQAWRETGTPQPDTKHWYEGDKGSHQGSGLLHTRVTELPHTGSLEGQGCCWPRGSTAQPASIAV